MGSLGMAALVGPFWKDGCPNNSNTGELDSRLLSIKFRVLGWLELSLKIQIFFGHTAQHAGS